MVKIKYTEGVSDFVRASDTLLPKGETVEVDEEEAKAIKEASENSLVKIEFDWPKTKKQQQVPKFESENK